MRALGALCALALAGCAAGGAGRFPAASERAAKPLTNFDCVVLASLADAGRPVSLATYSPAASND